MLQIYGPYFTFIDHRIESGAIRENRIEPRGVGYGGIKQGGLG